MEVLHKTQKVRIMNVLDEFEIYKSTKKKPKRHISDKLKYNSNSIYYLIYHITKFHNMHKLAHKPFK